MRTIRRTAAVAAAALLTLAATGQAAHAAGDSRSRLTKVSHGDPFASCTAGGTPTATLYPGGEVEPDLAVDALRPDHIIGVWQQDRWDDGGAHGIAGTYSTDGGRSFAETTLPFNSCAPGGLGYERASDPWVSFGPDGTAYADALAFDATTARNTVGAAVSHDGGRTWHNPTVLIDDTNIEFFNDKNSITADPRRAGTAYAVWDRLDGGPTGLQLLTGPTLMSVTHDSGRTWGAPQIIVHTGQFEQTIGNVIVADARTGVLYDFFNDIVFTDASGNTVLSATYEVVRSSNGGRTWSTPVPVASDSSIGDTDPNTGADLRTGAGLPSPAIDPVTGQLYVAYEGTDFTAGAYDQIQLVTSTDGGRRWSAPVRVNGAPASPAFTPTVAVNRDGTVAVTYYDVRTLTPDNTTTLPTSTWLTVSGRGGRHFDRERQIAPVFDWLSAPNADGFFLGDYEGLATQGSAFRPLFVTANSGQPDNSTDVYTGLFGGDGFHSVSGQTSPAPSVARPAQPRRVHARAIAIRN